VIESVMSQLEKRGKGMILMHDSHRRTAEALPELLCQLRAGGYKVVCVPTVIPPSITCLVISGRQLASSPISKNVAFRHRPGGL
jgi:hypothetical protein